LGKCLGANIEEQAELWLKGLAEPTEKVQMRVYLPPVEMLDSKEEVNCLAIRLILLQLRNLSQLSNLLTGLR
jgi:hypothetical protein